MKVFITGITGFVGSHCADYYSSAGHEVWGIGRKNSLPSYIAAHCNYLRADITQPLPEIDADVVIHAAALASDTATFEECYRANVEGTKNVLAACKSVAHFVYISSSSVYDFSDGKPKDEMEAGKNLYRLSSYGKTKWLAENIVQEATHFSKTSILRPRAIYGKYDSVLLPRLLRLVKGNYLLLPSHLSQNISLTHITNLVKAIDVCVHEQTGNKALFNIADETVYSLYNILTTLLPALVAKPLRVVNIPSILFDFVVRINKMLHISPHLNPFAALSLTQHAVVKTNAITNALGYSATTDFYKSYEEIINWIHKEEGWRYYFASAPKQ